MAQIVVSSSFKRFLIFITTTYTCIAASIINLSLVCVCCRSPGRHVRCSEQPSTDPVPAAQDSSPHTTQEEGANDKVAEEWQTQSSYSVGLETERSALEDQLVQSAPYEDVYKQTVNIVDEEVVEDVPLAHEPGLHQSETHSETDDQQLIQAQADTSTSSSLPPQNQAEVELPQSSANQDQAAAAADAAATASPADESYGELQIDPNTEAPIIAESSTPEPASPTSQTSSETPSSALEVASAGAPLKNSSATQCEVGSVALSSQPLASGSTLKSVEPEEPEGTGTNPDPNAAPDSAEPDLTELKQTANDSHPPEDQQVVKHEGGTDPHVLRKEDIPTFDEWKKQVMEVEEKKSQSLHTSSNGSPHPVKKVQKNFKNNYASVECGAKILAANSEAKSTSAILMENMDLYMLNPCSNKIWFVIELCEPIQVKQLDIANFELFSSTPKDFLVSISDRYPTNKWIKLGTFHARDERTVQSFPLDEQLYAKYVKVELLSHFGSEHFCPLSLIRVFGTSMVEEYDEIADSQYPSERVEYLDEDYDLHFLDYPPGYLPSEDKQSKNLLGSATNAILTMVNNIAANVLGGKPELEDGAQMEGNASSGTENITEVSAETTLSPTPTPTEQQAMLHTPELDPTLVKEDPELVTESPSEESRIVILIEDEEEEPAPPTVTLLDEEEREEEERRRAEDAWEKENMFYCGHFKTLSCLASLQEHLHLYCSAALALQRLRRDRSTHSNTNTKTQTPLPVPTQTQTSSPSSEKLPEAEQPTQAPQDEKIAPTDTTPAPHHVPEQLEPSVELSPDTILLEPSQTSPIPPHSFSDTLLSRPTPTQDVSETPPLTGELQDSRPQYLEHVPESSSSSLSPSSTISMLTPTSDLLSLETEIVELPVPTKEQLLQPLPTHTRPAEIPPPTELPTMTPEAVDPNRSVGPEDLQHKIEAPEAPSLTPQDEDVEDILLPASQSGAQRTATDFYAEPQNLSELSHGNGNGNGNQVHGSNQKESVFMRLNNRIKALEMNMSLSSRYLEELSQRYRKQMEEMQKAFNKTIIKLQNTSRIAEEQDQKQTDSIQVLQSQLENVTKLMLNLSATVSQLQKEVSDRQSYLVVSLVLCLALGLLLCMQCCRSSSNHSRSSAIPVSNHYPSPKRCFSSYDDMSLKRRVSCPLVRSKSFQLPTSEVGPDDLYIVEPLRFSPEKKKKRCKTKGGEKPETLRASVTEVTIANGGPKKDSVHVPHFLPSACSTRDGVSEGSSEGSSSCSSSSSTASDESCCSVQSNDQLSSNFLPAKNRTEKRSFKRRHSKIEQQQQQQQQPPQSHGRFRAGLLHTPITVATGVMPTLQELMKGKQELGVGAFGVTAAVTGRV
ncbi:hypothetical protein NFI96_024735 [Prochilodus magdalenae]|nr:hypothetical protein NFI96_024735 [Prochilodus magdalenae]